MAQQRRPQQPTTQAQPPARQRPPQPQQSNALVPLDHDPRLARVTDYINARRRAIDVLVPNPKAFGGDRMVALILQSIRKNPELLNCGAPSLFKAVFEAAKVGLEPDTPLAHCHVIPYASEATFVLGYQGAGVLTTRGGIAKWKAEAVYEFDEFDYEEGLHPKLHHKPKVKGDRGPFLGYYAIGWYRDRNVEPSFVYLREADLLDVEAHVLKCRVDQLDNSRKNMEADFKKAKSPWIRWRMRQRRKTALKRLGKDIIHADESRWDELRSVALAFQLDDAAEAGKSQMGMGSEIPKPDEGTVVQLDEGEGEQERDMLRRIEDTIDMIYAAADSETAAKARAIYGGDGPLADRLVQLDAIRRSLDGSMTEAQEAEFEEARAGGGK